MCTLQTNSCARAPQRESWRPACRDATLAEIGAVLLTEIPAAITAAGAPELGKLPRILASCDGVVRAADGSAWLVEAKHRTPFAPPAKARSEMAFLGRRCKPHAAVTVDHYVQAQLQMMVMDMQRCDLISYSVATSTIFRIMRDDQWCSLALQHLAHLEQQYLQHGKKPQADVFAADVAALHHELLRCTIEGMRMLATQKAIHVASRHNSANPGPPFLDHLPDSNRRKQETSRLLPMQSRELISVHEQCQSVNRSLFSQLFVTLQENWWTPSPARLHRRTQQEALCQRDTATGLPCLNCCLQHSRQQRHLLCQRRLLPLQQRLMRWRSPVPR